MEATVLVVVVIYWVFPVAAVTRHGWASSCRHDVDGVHERPYRWSRRSCQGAGNEGGGDVGGTEVKLSIAVVLDLWTSRR